MIALSSTTTSVATPPDPLPAPSLPCLDADTLILHNALHRARQSLTFDWYGRPASLRLLPEAIDVVTEMGVAICLGDEYLTLSGSRQAFDRLGEHPDRRRSLDEVDAELAAMWLEAAWLAWLEPLETTLGVDIRVHPADPKMHPASSISLILAFELDGTVHPLRIDLATTTAKRLLPLFDQHLPAQRATASGVMVTLDLTAGTQTLTLGEWRSLCPGDVVMLESFASNGAPDAAVLSIADRLECRVSLGTDSVRLEGPLMPPTASRVSNPSFEEGPMSEPPVDNDQPSSAAPDPQGGVDNPGLDALPVRLTCELGKLEMSLGELRELGQGSVLPLERRPEQAVDLIVNGRRMGHGRLVAIGDGIGVQIERLSLDD